jgi:hypothetical protein
VSNDHGTDEPQSQQYEIRISGPLGERWSAWFDGITITDEGDGTTVLRGAVVDQAALHGLLQRLRDLGLTLLSLRRLVPAPAVEPHLLPDHDHHDQPGAPS